MLSPSSSKIDMVINSPQTNRSLTKQNSEREVNSPKPWSKGTQSPGQVWGNKKVIHDPAMISPVLTGVKENDSEHGKQKLDLNLNERSAASIRVITLCSMPPTLQQVFIGVEDIEEVVDRAVIILVRKDVVVVAIQSFFKSAVLFSTAS